MLLAENSKKPVSPELEPEEIKVNAVSPGFIKTNLNNYGAWELSRRAPREPVRLALLGPDGLTGTYPLGKRTYPVVTQSRVPDRRHRLWI